MNKSGIGLGEKLSVIYKITNSINRAATLEEIYQRAIEGITEAFGIERASILLFNEDKFMEFKAWKGISDRYRKNVAGHTPWKFGQKNPEPIFIENVEKSRKLGEHKKVILEEGIRAMAFIPITYKGRTIGKFMLYYDRPHTFSEEEILMARILAEEIGFAVQQKRLESRLRESGEFLKALLGGAPEGIVLHRDNRVVYANDAFAHMLGYRSGTELIGRCIWDFVVKEEHIVEEIKKRVKRVYSGQEVPPLEEKLIKADGSIMYAEILATPVSIEGNIFSLVFARDITERKLLLEELQKFKKAVDKSKDMIVITDADGRIIYANEAFTEITGYTREEAYGKRMSILKSGMHSEEFYKMLWDTILRGEEFTTIFTDRKKSGEYFMIYTTITPIKDEDGNVVNFIGIGKDITKERVLEERLNKAMFYDPITNLPNRNLFIEKLKEALSLAKLKKRFVAVAVVDIDNFSIINDTYGEEVGNKVLYLVGHRIEELLRAGDIVSRVGADEFAIAMADVGEEEDVIYVVNRIMDGFKDLLSVLNISLDVSLTAGIALYPSDADTAMELLEKADLALTRAKRENVKVKFFHKELDEEAVEFVILSGRIKNAFDNKEFYTVYQGIYRYGNDKPVGFEALARWESSDLGYVSPMKFIPILESTKQIIRFGEEIFPLIRRDLEVLKERFGEEVFVSINLSPVQFEDPNLITMLKEIFSGLERNVAFEITENTLARNRRKAIRTLDRLHEEGFRIHIDDFGTGYSSLEYLKDFPVSGLKIDRSFVIDILEDEKDLSIVKIVITLAKELGFYTVAEGVEKKEQVELLNDMGCDYFQGFYLSKPLPLGKLLNQR